MTEKVRTAPYPANIFPSSSFSAPSADGSILHTRGRGKVPWHGSLSRCRQQSMKKARPTNFHYPTNHTYVYMVTLFPPNYHPIHPNTSHATYQLTSQLAYYFTHQPTNTRSRTREISLEATENVPGI